MYKLFFIPLYFLASTLFAQQIKFQQYIGWRGGDVELHTISNKQNSCTFIVSPDTVKALLFDNNGEITDQFTIPRQPKDEFRDGFIKAGIVYLYFYTGKKTHSLHTWRFNSSDKSLTENTVDFTTKDEKLVQHFNSDNYYGYLMVNARRNELTIYRFTDEAHYDTLSYHISDETLASITDQDVFNASYNIEKVDMQGECDIDVAQAPNKMYVANDAVYLLQDNKFSITNVYTFDLTNKISTFRNIDHKLLLSPHTYYNSNSYLAAGKLYFVNATTDTLLLQIIDFYTGTMLKEYRAAGNEEISFKNTPIMQEGSGVLNIPTDRELSKTKQLLRKMLNASAVIIATPDSSNDNYTVLTIGSYKKIYNTENGYTLAPIPGAAGATMFIPTGGFSSKSWVKSARFKVLIDNETDNQVAGYVSQSINDRIDEYTKGIKIPSDGANLFRQNGYYYYAYYNKDNRNIVAVKF